MSIKAKKLTFFVLIIMILAIPSSYLTLKIIKYEAYIWLPTYFFDTHPNNLGEIKNGHMCCF